MIYSPKVGSLLYDYVIPDDVINENDVINLKSTENWTKLIFCLDPPLVVVLLIGIPRTNLKTSYFQEYGFY